MWLASKPISFVNDVVSELHRTFGTRLVFNKIGRFWDWFDWHIIDGIVDGFAKQVRNQGETLRNLQSGRLQDYMGYTAIAVFMVILVYMWLYII